MHTHTQAVTYQTLHEPLDLSAVFKVVTDLAACGMTIAFVVMRIPTKTASAGESSRLVGSISQLPWEAVDLTLNQKTSEFFAGLSELLQLINTESSLDTFCSIILFVSLVRVIQCTALHPRLALLTGTLGHALDDLWCVVHFPCRFLSLAWLLCALAALPKRASAFADHVHTRFRHALLLIFLLVGSFAGERPSRSCLRLFALPAVRPSMIMLYD